MPEPAQASQASQFIAAMSSIAQSRRHHDGNLARKSPHGAAEIADPDDEHVEFREVQTVDDLADQTDAAGMAVLAESHASVRGFQQKAIYCAALLAVGVAWGCDRMKWNVPDAFYFTIVTVTTVGYGDFTPEEGEGRNDGDKLFICAFIFAGIALAGNFMHDLAALVAEIGRICAHFSNDSAMAAIYGTSRSP